MKLREGESIVVAWGANESGPGWSNALVWVLVRALDGSLRIDSLQPHEQSDEVHALHAVSAAAAVAMGRAIRRGTS